MLIVVEVEGEKEMLCVKIKLRTDLAAFWRYLKLSVREDTGGSMISTPLPLAAHSCKKISVLIAIL